LTVVAKKVEPENKSKSATRRRMNIVLRRVFRSRITPRVACTTNENVRSGFSGGSVMTNSRSLRQTKAARASASAWNTIGICQQAMLDLLAELKTQPQPLVAASLCEA
jgi:hypothetical protein